MSKLIEAVEAIEACEADPAAQPAAGAVWEGEVMDCACEPYLNRLCVTHYEERVRNEAIAALQAENAELKTKLSKVSARATNLADTIENKTIAAVFTSLAEQAK